MSVFNDAKRAWDVEIELEAARLIRRGVPPHQAMEQARRNVQLRRERQANVELERWRNDD